jgi:[acyl-carrier-protein] S-malonyltransferase
MGKDLYMGSDKAKELFKKANEILGFDIAQVMFEGTETELKQTRVTQPAIFIHSVIAALLANDFKPDMVAGHSLGEFSALVAAGSLSFEDGLQLVYKRAMAMQKACEMSPSTMAAVLALADEKVEEICGQIEDIVVPANYNCPGQLVISGSIKGVEEACVKLKEAGAKRALVLPVGGAFHSPLMEPAKVELAAAIQSTSFNSPVCTIYQNVNAKPSTDVETIKKNLVDQLTAPVKWTQTVENMIADGAEEFIECGPGKVLQGLVKKVNGEMAVRSI